MNKVTCKRDFRSLRIYINDLLHTEILMDSYDGIQSWLEGTNKFNYVIEVYRKNDKSIIYQYDDREIWENILRLIDANL